MKINPLSISLNGLNGRQKIMVQDILVAWGIYERYSSNAPEIRRMTGQITCSPTHRLQLDNIQENCDSTHTPYTSKYSDDCLEALKRLICIDIRKQNKNLARILIARYRWGDYNHKEKWTKMGISKTTFYDRLTTAHERVYTKFDWELTK